MLVEVDSKTYNNLFNDSPHPYISSGFIELNAHKVDNILRIVESPQRTSMGLIVGLKDGLLKSPFSAPFGGFHFRKDNQYLSEIETFIINLKEFIKKENLKGIEITLPPDIYHLSFNSKCINIFLRNEFELSVPEITNWINLNEFTGMFLNRGARKYYNQALRHELRFEILNDINEKEKGFNIICENRARFGRPIYMTFSDLIKTGNLWKVDFFGVYNNYNNLLSAGVFYRGHESIIQGIFWGDSEEGRPLRAIDFLSLNIWNFYKNLKYQAIDLGISTEDGIPNEGLIRFKESHDCNSSLRFSFKWKNI